MLVVKCVYAPQYTDRLTKGLLYEVIGETDTAYKIIDDRRHNMYFDKNYFDTYGTVQLQKEGGRIEDCPKCGCRVYEYLK